MFFFSSRRRHTRCALVLEFRRVLFRAPVSGRWHSPPPLSLQSPSPAPDDNDNPARRPWRPARWQGQNPVRESSRPQVRSRAPLLKSVPRQQRILPVLLHAYACIKSSSTQPPTNPPGPSHHFHPF